MAILSRSRRLRKELTLLDVYCIATGATLSGGFFLLPGLAAIEAGPAIVLAYLIAAVPMVPAMLSVVELATAMPRAGGVYYFLDRSLGPLVGTFAGFGTWLAVALKVSFALVGMRAYIELFAPSVPPVPLAVGLACAIGAVCLFGAKLSGGFQVVLVATLLVILAAFIGGSLPRVRGAHFSGFFDAGSGAIFATAGFVYISYVGVTKVASLAEEVKNPERNLPLGVFLSLATALVVYGLGTFVLVGLIPPAELAGDLTPVATAAGLRFGSWGVVLVTVAALLAFTSVANAGVLSASRYPLAMSRDHLLPAPLRRLGRRGTPSLSIVVTVATIAAFLVLFDPARIAKFGSVLQLTIFALVCLAVIVMRESRIESYDPGYRSPGYPWTQIAGVATALWLASRMGRGPVLFSLGLIAASCAWYFSYARSRIERGGAIFHVFERLGRQRFAGLDPELRSILKEKGLREEDPFEEIVARAGAFDAPPGTSFDQVVARAADWLARRIPTSAEILAARFREGTRIGMTPVERGVALPHLRAPEIEVSELVLVRAPGGIRVVAGDLLGETHASEPVYAIFFLASPERDPGQHLRLLAQIAGRVEDESFQSEWLDAPHEQALKEVLLRSERFVSLALRADAPTRELIGRALREIEFPADCLVAVVHRGSESIVPHGPTQLEEGDRLTVIGRPSGIRALQKRYGLR